MFEQYQHYRVNDFVRDESFINWVKKPDARYEVFWQRFLSNHPNRRSEVEQARRLVQALSEAASPEYRAEDAGLIWRAIEKNLPMAEKPVRPARRYGVFFRWVAAASAALILAFSGHWILNRSAGGNAAVALEKRDNPAQPNAVEVFNTSEKAQWVALPDGSRLSLLPQGKARFAKTFSGDTREVWLEGTAFFEVMPDATKPFFVYSGAVITKVLGTSFWVRANPSEAKMVVSVRTGRVSVYAGGQKEQTPRPLNAGLVLTPNQQAIYDPEKDAFTHTLIEKPVLLIKPEELPDFEFKDAPVSLILSAISRAYGVEIIFDEKAFDQCTLTTTLTSETLFEKLDVICKATAASYQIVEKQVLISGKGCD